MSSSPFYLSTDGILFIVRDSTQEMRDMTVQERELYRCEDFENNMFKTEKGVRAQREEVVEKLE